MKVIVAGGTGFIGREFCRVLTQAGHEAVVLSRGPLAGGPRSVLWDGASSGDWQGELEGATAVINLAGEPIADGRWTTQRRKVLSESRLASARALVAGLSAAKAKPRVFISASAIGYYGNRGDETLDESARAGEGFLAQLCVSWERESAVAEALGVRVVNLRLGVVLGAGGALAKMLPAFRLGFGGRLGDGRQWMPWIWIGDAARLAVFIASSELSGPVNAVAPEPARNADFSAALGRVLRRPAVLPVPAFALRLVFGPIADEALLASQRAVPRKALDAGFAFEKPALADALAAAIAHR